MVADRNALAKNMDAQHKSAECGLAEEIGAPLRSSKRHCKQDSGSHDVHIYNGNCIRQIQFEGYDSRWDRIAHAYRFSLNRENAACSGLGGRRGKPQAIVSSPGIRTLIVARWRQNAKPDVVGFQGNPFEITGLR